MINKHWNITCPMCKRRSLTMYPTGMARCNRCWHCSNKIERWLENWLDIKIVLTAAAAVIVALAVYAVYSHG